MSQSNNLRRKILLPIALLKADYQRKQPQISLNRYLMLSKGFIAESTILYNLTMKNFNYYLSDYQAMNTRDINHQSAYFLNNKVAFGDMLEGLAEMPATLAIIQNREFISRTELFYDAKTLVDYLQADSLRKVVIKPIFGMEGQGVWVVNWEDGKVRMNDQLLSSEAFQRYLLSLEVGYFISEYICQGQFSQSLFPNSVNTIRMLTMIDPANQQAFIAASTYRVGTNLSAPTDNFRRQGLSVAVNPVSGRLGRAAMIPQNGQLQWYENHPDTKKQLTGRIIPNWEQVTRCVLDVANYVYQTKQIHYVGWDVVLTDTGISLLEGNSIPGVSLHQVHHPLLTNPDVKRFYAFHGVV